MDALENRQRPVDDRARVLGAALMEGAGFKAALMCCGGPDS